MMRSRRFEVVMNYLTWGIEVSYTSANLQKLTMFIPGEAAGHWWNEMNKFAQYVESLPIHIDPPPSSLEKFNNWHSPPKRVKL